MPIVGLYQQSLSHPAIAAVCKGMLYGKGKLGSVFDDFQDEIPEKGIALAATAVSITSILVSWVMS